MIHTREDGLALQLAEAFPAFHEIPQEFGLHAGGREGFYLIDGHICSWEGPFAEVSSPVCIKHDGILARPVIGRVPSMDETAAMMALDAACRAWNSGRGDWPTTSSSARIRATEDFVVRMHESRQEIIGLLMWEIGKTLEDSEKEFDRTILYINQTVEALKGRDHASRGFSLRGGVISRSRPAPLGVCLLMGPFNNPLYETYTMLIPALIMGNTVVVKPPKFGVLLHQPLLKALAESFPPGVVNVIYGNGNGTDNMGPLMKSGQVDVLAFIGSGSGAAALIQQHPLPHRLRCVLGLDAKNPALVMPDADIDVAVRECVKGALTFNGQRCTALKMIFVHESVVDPFLEKFCSAVNALPIGMPWHKGVKITPLPEFGKVSSMQALVDDAVVKGARIVNKGGGTACETLYSPAVIYPVSPSAALYNKEQFGPVIPVCSYGNEEEFLRFVAESSYGQQVSLFGRSPGKMAHLVDHLTNQVCRINLNCQCRRGPDILPFTGRRGSAQGTLSIADTLNCFSIPSLVAAESDPENERIIHQTLSAD